MYSGTTFHNKSGNIIGTHQKIDRVARRNLTRLTHTKNFPGIKSILHFEGRNGPDGIKAKSPAKDEPWHYIDPSNPNDSELIDLIDSHYKQLVIELRAKNRERAAFEASWLAHALVDGLTPAHHFPYEEELAKLRLGEDKSSRTNYKEKWVMKGKTPSEQLKNNWKMWGAKGLFTTHAAFEMGIAYALAPMRIRNSLPSHDELRNAKKTGIQQTFVLSVQKIATLHMYEEFYVTGWTARLAREMRDVLIPEIVKVVTIVWYLALAEAGMVSPRSTAP